MSEVFSKFSSLAACFAPAAAAASLIVPALAPPPPRRPLPWDKPQQQARRTSALLFIRGKHTYNTVFIFFSFGTSS